MSIEAAVHAKAIDLNQLSLDMCAAAGSGHPTTAMSLGHIATVLLYQRMRWMPDAPAYPTSDRLVLSEGHAVPIVYAACADLGVVVGDGENKRNLSRNDVLNLREADSPLDGHPNPMEGFPFFDAATGSLGQGLSVAAGLGVAARDDDLDKKIYCIIGDGESREGQIAEALECIMDERLTNVLPIFNCNGYGQADKVSPLQSPDAIVRKLEALGYTVVDIDGHAPAQILAALDQFAKLGSDDAPMAMVARTVKGWGAASLQGGGWHGKPASGDALDKAKEELKTTGVGLTSALATDDALRIYPPAEYVQPDVSISEIPNLHQTMDAADMTHLRTSARLSTRKAYGLALRALGKANPRVYALDGDVSNSTFAQWFANDAETKGRFIECKIAEQNMFSVAAGLSAAGKIPFCSSFAKFITRGYDQIEMAINSGANIKMVGSHSGISLAADGPSQMALPDIAWFRSLSTVTNQRGNPACYILQPSDAYAAYGLTLAMAEYHGACYMRTHRPDVDMIYNAQSKFTLGGLEVLNKGRDLLIISGGYMVHRCLEAINTLDKGGMDIGLVDLYSLPFDEEHLLDLCNDAGGNVLVVEDNYGGSLGSAVADACTASGDGFTIEQMYVNRIPKSCRNEEAILKYCGLHPNDIAAKAASMLGVVEV